MARARLWLLPGGTRTERLRLDGAWWPRSRDLPRELPPLIAAADVRFGPVERITVNTSLWPEPPHRIAVSGRTIPVGRFPAGKDTVEVCVLSNSAGRWDLLVVPPECAFAEADMPLPAIRDALGHPAAEPWLAWAEAGLPAHEAAQEAVWDSEGGHSPERVMAS